MNKRILSILLIGVLLLAAVGCKSNNSDAPGIINGGSNQAGGNGNNDSGEGAGSNTPGAPDQGGDSSNEDSNTPGDTTPGGNDSGNTNTTPGGNSGNGGNTSGNPAGGQSSLKETFVAGKPISVKAGESVWFGPASPAQKEQLTFTDASGKATAVAVDALTKVDVFGNGFAIYSYKAPSDGSVAVSVNKNYEKMFLAAKEKMDVNAYYGYWDNIKGRNLYDQGLDKSSKWLNISGKESKSDLGGATHAIPVGKGDTLSFGPVRAGTPVLGWGYDSNMKPIEMITGYGLKENFVFNQGMRAYTFEVPEGVAYVRFNVAERESEMFAIAKNYEFNETQYRKLSGANTEHAEDPLYQMNCLFLGDSICAAAADSAANGLKGWARRVKELAGADCVNAGVSGAALSDCRLSRENATERHQIYRQLLANKNKDFDYVLIHGGVNDAWDDVKIGSVSNSYDPDVFDLSTYAGGLEMTIYTAITEFGDTAAIGYLINFASPLHSKANDTGPYFEVGKEICKKWNIQYLDLYNELDFDTDRYTKLNDNGVSDKIHPNEAGYDILGPVITDFMRGMTPVTKKVLDEMNS